MNAAERAYEAIVAFWEEAGLEPSPSPWPAGARPAPSTPAPAPVAPKAAAAAPVSGPSEAARAAAAAAQDFASLTAAIEAFEGCALKKSARRTVVADGVFGSPVLIIGEAPGAEEDAAGKPFVGRAGQLLDRMLAAIGLSRQTNCLISNCVYWRPPGNRNPTAEELTVCRPFVERLIALSQPKLLLLIGGISGQFLSGRSEGVTRLRGQRLALPFEGLTTPVHAMVMLHPAYLLRQPAQKRLAWADLLAAEAWLEELQAPRAERP